MSAPLPDDHARTILLEAVRTGQRLPVAARLADVAPETLSEWLHRGRGEDVRPATAATFLLAQGMTLEDVKNLLGHGSITLTSNTYGHVLEQRQRQVARAMDAVLGG